MPRQILNCVILFGYSLLPCLTLSPVKLAITHILLDIPIDVVNQMNHVDSKSGKSPIQKHLYAEPLVLSIKKRGTKKIVPLFELDNLPEKHELQVPIFLSHHDTLYVHTKFKRVERQTTVRMRGMSLDTPKKVPYESAIKICITEGRENIVIHVLHDAPTPRSLEKIEKEIEEDDDGDDEFILADLIVDREGGISIDPDIDHYVDEPDTAKYALRRDSSLDIKRAGLIKNKTGGLKKRLSRNKSF